MFMRVFGFAAASALLLANNALAKPKPVVEELFKANRTLSGRVVAYPDGTPEMRVYRITLPVGAQIPLHIHPLSRNALGREAVRDDADTDAHSRRRRPLHLPGLLRHDHHGHWLWRRPPQRATRGHAPGDCGSDRGELTWSGGLSVY